MWVRNVYVRRAASVLVSRNSDIDSATVSDHPWRRSESSPTQQRIPSRNDLVDSSSEQVGISPQNLIQGN